MFACVLGVLLPASAWCEEIKYRKECVDDLIIEIEEYLANTDSEIAQRIWWATSDGGYCGDYLYGRLLNICRTKGCVQLLDARKMQIDIEFWAVETQTVIIARDEATTEDTGDYLLNKRLTETASINITCVQNIPVGIQAPPKWERYRGREYITPGDQIDAPVSVISKLLCEMDDDLKCSSVVEPKEIRSTSLIRGVRASYRARVRAYKDQIASIRWLWIKGLALIVISTIIGLRFGSTAATFLTVVVSIGLISRQPLLWRAHMWWSVGEMMWLQTVWSCYGFDQAAYQGYVKQKIETEHEDLPALVTANKLFVATQTLQVGMTGIQSVRDLKKVLEDRRTMLTKKMGIHSLIRRVTRMVLITMTAIAITGALLGYGVIGSLAVCIIVIMQAFIQVYSPLPLLSADRLQQSVCELQDLEHLADKIVFDSSQDSVSRKMLESLLIQAGVHIYDMYADSMRSMRARRRLMSMQ